MKIMPVQKQTRAGHRTRFKAIVAMGDHNGHVGLGVKCSKEVATAIRGAIMLAKLTVIPVRRGYWGNKIGAPHTVPCKVRFYAVLYILISNLISFSFYTTKLLNSCHIKTNKIYYLCYQERIKVNNGVPFLAFQLMQFCKNIV